MKEKQNIKQFFIIQTKIKSKRSKNINDQQAYDATLKWINQN